MSDLHLDMDNGQMPKLAKSNSSKRSCLMDGGFPFTVIVDVPLNQKVVIVCSDLTLRLKLHDNETIKINQIVLNFEMRWPCSHFDKI